MGSVHGLRIAKSQDSYSCSWRDYSARVPLNESMVNGAVQHGRPFTNLQTAGRLFVMPERHFAFCPIAKNGCSAWDHVLRNMFEGNTDHTHVPAELFYGIGEVSQQKYKLEGVHAVFDDPEATRAVFLRDPVARFLSAFLGKCIQNPGQGHCLAAPSGFVDGKPVTLQHAVLWALAQNLTSTYDNHWKLQLEHCSLRTTLSFFTFVGMVQKDAYSNDGWCLLSDSGLSEFNIHNGKPIFAETTSTDDNIHNGKPATSTDDDERAFLKKSFKSKAAEELYAHMKDDYDFFGFPKPDWIQEATGEWYDDSGPIVEALAKKMNTRISDMTLKEVEMGDAEYDISDYAQVMLA